jgi:hypothetical protein
MMWSELGSLNFTDGPPQKATYHREDSLGLLETVTRSGPKIKRSFEGVGPYMEEVKMKGKQVRCSCGLRA